MAGVRSTTMALRRTSVLLGIALAGLVAATPVAAKEGVRATIHTAVPLDAPAGTKLSVGWSLWSPDGHGHRRLFSANGVFVRLLSKAGSAARTGFAPSGSYTGAEYSAVVTVPDGGIRDVQIGLRGFTSGANGTHNADVLFPITNDPLPGVAAVVQPAADTDRTPWIVGALFGCVLVAVASLGVARVRRRQPDVLSEG
jgi:hypothetical protein